ncbi:hypothetical protein CS022_23805 [Veronia nyctiphanis]|uniref:Uncharacterized protein n=1 Tax=Veronia nyctiphanis TaxID=1278244 RepID=A0A4Q0YJT1_9GAMM|nr:hypothetical protein [Veronia nyctiphanis]RXJ69469.1 hypothetical protein CS022_23805 [Veronia nyctiphanis]
MAVKQQKKAKKTEYEILFILISILLKKPVFSFVSTGIEEKPAIRTNKLIDQAPTMILGMTNWSSAIPKSLKIDATNSEIEHIASSISAGPIHLTLFKVEHRLSSMVGYHIIF